MTGALLALSGQARFPVVVGQIALYAGGLARGGVHASNYAGGRASSVTRAIH